MCSSGTLTIAQQASHITIAYIMPAVPTYHPELALLD
jgi:hypothetical protein